MRSLEILAGFLPCEGGQRGFARAALGCLRAALERTPSVSVSPQRMFGENACVPAGPLDRIFLLVSHDAPEIVVRRMEPEELARRLPFALQAEQSGGRAQATSGADNDPSQPKPAYQTASIPSQAVADFSASGGGD